MKTTTIECGQCGGAGYTWRDAADSHGEHYTADEGCQGCGGTGAVEARCEGDCGPAVSSLLVSDVLGTRLIHLCAECAAKEEQEERTKPEPYIAIAVVASEWMRRVLAETEGGIDDSAARPAYRSGRAA